MHYRVAIALIFLVSYLPRTGGCVQRAGFSVQDSIAMRRFNLPSELERSDQPLYSPDYSHFLVITSRGLIDSDRTESEIVLFDTAAVKKYLHSPVGTMPPRPRTVARVAAIPGNWETSPYSAVISQARWSEDSKSVFFLAETDGGERGLYQCDLMGSKPQKLSAPGRDVRSYDFNGKRVVYLGAHPADLRKATERMGGYQINSDAISITGMSLESILARQDISDPNLSPWPAELELVVISMNGSRRGNGDYRVVNRYIDSGLSGAYAKDLVSISPDGYHVVQLMPVDKVPTSWADYDPDPPFDYLRIRPADQRTTSPESYFLPREYILLDLRTPGHERRMNAPLGYSLAYHDAVEVKWSPDGSRVLLTNTFLDLDPVAKASRIRRASRPCSAAVEVVASGDVECIAESRSSYSDLYSGKTDLQLSDARFDPTGREIVLRYRDTSIKENSDASETVSYRLNVGKWITEAAGPWVGEVGRKPEDNLLIRIEQGLNAPPSLWAGRGQRIERKLWEPNTAIAHASLGNASLYRWKDTSGYEWTGVLVLPPDYNPSQRYPLVIQTHGYSDFQFVTDGFYPTAMAARPLANAGIIVLQMDVRRDHYLTPQELPDHSRVIQSATDALVAGGLVARTRIGILGYSRTCWYVESDLIAHPERFAAAVLADGLDESYMQYMLFGEGQSTYFSETDKIHGGRPFGENFAIWARSAPDFRLDRIRAPLLIQAVNQQSVLFEWEIYSSLRQQGKPVDLIYLTHGQHVLQRPLHLLASEQSTVDWFRFWLQGYEDDDPRKRMQYAHWKAMHPSEHPRIPE